MLKPKPISHDGPFKIMHFFHSITLWPCCSLCSASLCARRLALSWKNWFEELDLPHKVSLSACVCTSFTKVCTRVCMSVHICSHASLLYLLAACLFYSRWQCTVLLICHLCFVHEWYAFGIPFPYNFMALTQSYCRQCFMSTNRLAGRFDEETVMSRETDLDFTNPRWQNVCMEKVGMN